MLHSKKKKEKITKTVSCEGRLITLLRSLSPSTPMVCGYSSCTSCVGLSVAKDHSSGWRWRLPSSTCGDTAVCLTTGQHPRHTSNYPVTSQHSVSWTPECLLLLHLPPSPRFISKAIKRLFISPYSIYSGSSAVQVKRLQCLRENQLMAFISLHFPQ